MKQFERRSLELTAEQWATLENLAIELGAIAPTGPTAGQPSWRTMVKAITDGELTVKEKDMMDLTQTPDLLEWQEGNITATYVLCENASMESPIYRVLTVGDESHCEGHLYYYVDGVETRNEERFVIPYTLGHVVGETYYQGTNDSRFKPVHRDRFIGRVYVGETFVV